MRKFLSVTLAITCLITGLQGQSTTANANAPVIQFQSTDTTSTADWPLNIYLGTTAAGTQELYYATQATTTPTLNSAGTAAANFLTDAGTAAQNTLFAQYKLATGIPLTQTIVLTGKTSGGTTGVTVIMPVGPQVSLLVTASGGTGTAAYAAAPTTLTASAAFTSPACGSYYVDCTTGLLYVQLATAATSAATGVCTVTIAQSAGTFAGLAYATANVPSSTNQVGALQTAIKTGAGTTASANTAYVCSGATATTITGSNTLIYYVIPSTAAATSTTALAAAIKTGTSFTNTGTYSLVSGFAVPVTNSISAGFTTLITASAPKPTLITVSALTDSNSPLTVGGSSVVAGFANQLTFLTTGSTTLASQYAVGLPVTSTITLANDQNSVVAQVITLSIGTQVSLSVTACATTTASASACTPTASGASAQTAALAAGAACGQYYLDCAGGTIQLAFSAAANSAGSNYQTCAFTITQVPALFGALSYATAPPSSSYTTIGSAIQTQASAPNAATICASVTASGTTLLYFIDQFASTAATTDLTTAQTKLNSALKTKTAFSVSARLLEEEESFRVLATTYTLTSGYANSLPTAASAGFTAPSSTATASLAANTSTTTTTTSAQSLSLQVVAVVISSIATLLGLIL